ncbi:sulfatase [Fictibacillus macauensis ZFHKF-1]|uniref:Sulfatase n=1 Tax=Fictibacillus macauensis ZFHKF-1 TaxID=1196324 RepID=I8UHA3_9BACL|nr:LTA synthase family protein [Fictibacillus macauensis]EIT86290.1 sulfatase [Fictibacillus macauensis ZFHKF-1]
MKGLLKAGHNALQKSFGFFILAVILFWLKTYFGYQFEFKLGIDNGMQKFLLLINPISSALFIFGLALFAKGRRAYIWTIIFNFILSFILFANIVYYRFYNDFITIPTLTQTNNFGSLGGSVWELLKFYDPIYFLDTIILIVLVATKVVKPAPVRMGLKKVQIVLASAIALLIVNIGLAETDRPQLLTRTFDRNYLVKYLGTYNFIVYDAVQNLRISAQKASASSNDLGDILNFKNANYAKPDPVYFGKAKGKNVIYIHLESFQNFLINYKLHGKEVTPFLNSFTKNKNTMYFDNFFHQTGQGKTSDAEFMLENSIYGLPQGSAFTTNSTNTFQAAPAILGQKGYSSAVFHGNKKTFWNRNEVYKSFGYDKFYDAGFFDMNDQDVLNYGLKDKPFFNEALPLMKDLKEPFYAKFISLSNHFPYTTPEDQSSIEPADTGDGSVDRYFQTARYLDESVRKFVDYLKKTGLYDRSVIVMYGDHYGISENHNEAMAKVLNKEEITPYDSAQLQKVPFMIHAPGVKGGTMHQYGGQIDVMPTLMHLLGIDTKKYVQFGTDLLSKQHQQIVPFRNGSFVSPFVTSVNGKYYDSQTGELLDEAAVEKDKRIKKAQNFTEKTLAMSDKLVYKDLLRYYTPKGFKPVDRNDYNYNMTKAESEKIQERAQEIAKKLQESEAKLMEQRKKAKEKLKQKEGSTTEELSK